MNPAASDTPLQQRPRTAALRGTSRGRVPGRLRVRRLWLAPSGCSRRWMRRPIRVRGLLRPGGPRKIQGSLRWPGGRLRRVRRKWLQPVRRLMYQSWRWSCVRQVRKPARVLRTGSAAASSGVPSWSYCAPEGPTPEVVWAPREDHLHSARAASVIGLMSIFRPATSGFGAQIGSMSA